MDETLNANQTILLTGCAGFIGSRVAALMLDRGYRVIGIDNLNDYYDVRLKDWRLGQLTHANFVFSPIDVEDRQGLAELFGSNRFDAVVNLAARAGVRYSVVNPYIYFSTNVTGALNLLELARQHDVRKFVLASTSSLYAGQPTPFVESLPVNQPISPYAASKKSAEVTAFTYHHLHGIDVSVLRYFTVYGPAGRPDMAVLRFVHWIATEQPIQLFGDGSFSRDFTYVDDIAEGTVRALRPLGYQIINLGGGNTPISMRQLIETLQSLLDKQAVLDCRPVHAADMSVTWANIDKAGRLLDWRPQVSLTEGLRKTVDWYRQHVDLAREVLAGAGAD